MFRYESGDTRRKVNMGGHPSDKKSSLERMLDILIGFGDCGGALSFDQMRELSNSSRSTAYRYLHILRDYELVEESTGTGRYRLGPSVTRLAHTQLYERDLVNRVYPVIQALSKLSGETVLISRRAGDRMVIIASVESDKMLRVSVNAADNLPINRASFGKLYMALQANRINTKSIAARKMRSLGLKDEAFQEELKSIRRLDYAISVSEVEVGAASISKPVRHRNGDMFAALTIAGPAVRLTPGRMKALLPALSKTSREISEVLLLADAS